MDRPCGWEQEDRTNQLYGHFRRRYSYDFGPRYGQTHHHSRVVRDSSEPDGSAVFGQLSTFSSRGPSRYGAGRPDIAAPGQAIVSSRSWFSLPEAAPPFGGLWYFTALSGTSMASPHVAGAAALILSLRPNLTCEQVKQILTQTARRDGFAASAPDNAWGAGKLDITAAVQRALAAQFAVVRNVSINQPTIQWQTDLPTTGAVRFHTRQRHLELGKSARSQTDLALSTNHALTLTELTTGTCFCEILAFTQDNLLTADDNNGSFHVMNVP